MSIKTGIDMLQVGALRMPFLFASLNGALLVGEGMYRTVRNTLEFIGFNGESGFSKWIQTMSNRIVSEDSQKEVVRILRPYQKLSHTTLAVSAVACCAIGTFGSAFVAYVFGPAPAIYNKVLTYLGPIRITNDNHPWLQAGINYFTNR